MLVIIGIVSFITGSIVGFGICAYLICKKEGISQ